MGSNMFTDKHVDVWEAVGKLDLFGMARVVQSVHKQMEWKTGEKGGEFQEGKRQQLQTLPASYRLG
jgi:hypothetical protein